MKSSLKIACSGKAPWKHAYEFKIETSTLKGKWFLHFKTYHA